MLTAATFAAQQPACYASGHGYVGNIMLGTILHQRKQSRSENTDVRTKQHSTGIPALTFSIVHSTPLNTRPIKAKFLPYDNDFVPMSLKPAPIFCRVDILSSYTMELSYDEVKSPNKRPKPPPTKADRAHKSSIEL